MDNLSDDLLVSFDSFLSQYCNETVKSDILSSVNNKLQDEVDKYHQENQRLQEKIIQRDSEIIQANEKYNNLVLKVNELIIENDKENSARAIVVRLNYDVSYNNMKL